MYDVIQMTDPHQSMFSFDNLITESTSDQFYTEAVFTGGKDKLKPLVDSIAKIQDVLLLTIGKKDGKDGKKLDPKDFNPTAFWKSNGWKVFEDNIKTIFGFRNVSINPYIERYSKKLDEFESHELNASVYRTPRYPIMGLITDKGFYDVSRSVDMTIYISLGMIKDLTPEELVAVFLHEFGHSIDPALTDIRYVGTNIFVKYITDRKTSLTKEEKKVVTENKNKILKLIFSIGNSIGNFFKGIAEWIKFKFNKGKYEEEKINKLRQALKDDKDDFKRQEFSEAFADNFARMYGYGPQLMSAIKKLSKNEEKQLNSWISKEHKRELAIFMMAQDALKDVHKTEIHRVKALIKEYKDDIADPNIPKEVKKSLEEDMKSLEEMLDSYTKDFSDFQNRINKLIIEELDLKETGAKDEKIMESVMTESTKKHPRVSKDKDVEKFRMQAMVNKFGSSSASNPSTAITNLEGKVKNAIKRFNEATARKSVYFELGNVIKDDNKRTITKIGGIPYWPKNMEWPTGKSAGKTFPMICLAQINLSEVPHIDGFPTSGLLQFFAVNWSGDHKVIYHKIFNSKDLLDDVPRCTTKPKGENVPGWDAFEDYDMKNIVYYPKAKLETMGMTTSMDNFFPEIIKYLNEELGTDYKKMRDIPRDIEDLLFDNADQGFGCRMGGYPFYMQGEPNLKAEEREVLLLQIDSEGEIMLGDCGSLQFLCSADTLKKKDFSNGKTHFDIACG